MEPKKQYDRMRKEDAKMARALRAHADRLEADARRARAAANALRVGKVGPRRPGAARRPQRG